MPILPAGEITDLVTVGGADVVVVDDSSAIAQS